MKYSGLTDIGLHRQENQDSFSLEETSQYVLAVVCDGMGGQRGGKIASLLAANTYMEQLKTLLSSDMTARQLRELSSFCVAQANTAVHQRALEDPDCRGMGTTLVSAICHDGNAVVSNIGDSRAYLIRGGEISRITHDHSVVEHLVEKGDITAEEARTHPNRNLITRALGPETDAACDSYEMILNEGDLLLLCTDGLIVTATDEEILRAVYSTSDLQDRLSALIALAKQHGAPDNVTAVLLENS